MMTSIDQRERLLQSNQKLNHASTILDDAIATAEETVDIGIDAMERLDQQTAQLKRMKTTVRIHYKLTRD
jgi:hypothetical protein